MDELTEIKNRLTELFAEIEINEVIEDNSVTLYTIVDEIIFRETVESKLKDYALLSCYQHLYSYLKEHKDDPTGERWKIRKAFQDQWIDNVINGYGDENGETIPSTKQVIDRLNDDNKNANV